jgi:hypothetical protein
MSENGLRKLFRINEIKILMSVTGLQFAGNYTIGNIQVCYAAVLSVSIVECSWFYCPHQIFIFEIQWKKKRKEKLNAY